MVPIIMLSLWTKLATFFSSIKLIIGLLLKFSMDFSVISIKSWENIFHCYVASSSYCFSSNMSSPYCEYHHFWLNILMIYFSSCLYHYTGNDFLCKMSNYVMNLNLFPLLNHYYKKIICGEWRIGMLVFILAMLLCADSSFVCFVFPFFLDFL